MNFLIETIRLGLSNIRLHALRSFLTALGIILGVAAVITMVSVGEGAKRDALMQIEQLGAKNLIIRSVRPPESNQQQQQQQRGFMARFGLTRETLEVVRSNFPDAEAVVPLKEVGSQVSREDRRQTSQAFGTTPDLINVAKLRIARGRYLTDADMELQSQVAVIGADVVSELFPWDDPIDKTIRIDTKSFTVVGILEEVGLSGGAGASLVGRDLNRDLHIPMSTARAVFGDVVMRRTSGTFQASEVQVSEIYVAVPSTETVLDDAQRLKRILQVRHGDTNDVTLIVPRELLEQKRRVAATYQAVLAAIAGISLLVGGIGIMNIMLATVTERTREIGIRRALGATRKHITWQFLVETGVLSAAGGMLGVGFGIGGSLAIRLLERLREIELIRPLIPVDFRMPTELTPWSIILAFTVAVLTGLAFGIYPARKAARQDPIVALRHE